MTVKVLETDQWTSSGNVTEFSWKKLKDNGIQCVSGGDSEAARIMFGGSFRFREVNETDSPSIGSVWFIENEKGFPAIWKTRYDSSG
jgi:hypothetical protein